MTMILSVAVLAALGLGLGWLLGLASQWLGATTDPVVERLTEALPGSQCGQCGYPGCGQAAIALSKGEAPVTLCPPGGRVVAEKLAEILGTTFDPGNLPDRGPLLARVRTDSCIGCSRCIKSCPTDAILGAAKQIHNVFREACTGCEACIEKCPTEALVMKPVPVTLQHWVMPKPRLA